MDREIERRIEVCARADDAEWDELVLGARNLGKAQMTFLREHPPGLVRALWLHFEATRDRCGCATTAHERPECTVPLVERLLQDGEIA
ncbi:MAG TPA: hypothetical protein VHH11_04970 [Gammaproteobacteria bacterium]|nr:hypothetical protein [Gammaproteobacteria bacterium]